MSVCKSVPKRVLSFNVCSRFFLSFYLSYSLCLPMFSLLLSLPYYPRASSPPFRPALSLSCPPSIASPSCARWRPSPWQFCCSAINWFILWFPSSSYFRLFFRFWYLFLCFGFDFVFDFSLYYIFLWCFGMVDFLSLLLLFLDLTPNASNSITDIH